MWVAVLPSEPLELVVAGPKIADGEPWMGGLAGTQELQLQQGQTD